MSICIDLEVLLGKKHEKPVVPLNITITIATQSLTFCMVLFSISVEMTIQRRVLLGSTGNLFLQQRACQSHAN